MSSHTNESPAPAPDVATMVETLGAAVDAGRMSHADAVVRLSQGYGFTEYGAIDVLRSWPSYRADMDQIKAIANSDADPGEISAQLADLKWRAHALRRAVQSQMIAPAAAYAPRRRGSRLAGGWSDGR